MKVIFIILVWFLSFSTEASEPLFKNITIQQSCKSDNFYNSYIRFDSNGENHIAIQSSQIIINTSMKRKGNIIKFYFESTKDLGRGGVNIPWSKVSKEKEVLTLITLDNAKGIHSIQWHGLYNKVTQKYLLQNLFQINDDTFRSCVLDGNGEWINYISPPKYPKPIGVQCLTKIEKEKVKSAIKSMGDYYGDVPNFIQCNPSKTYLEKHVCSNEDLLLAFNLESKSSVYAYENATKREVNHLTYNLKNSIWNKNYNTEKKKLDTLCYELKHQTSDYLGGKSPYLVGDIEGIDNVVFVQVNDHGASLQFDSKIVYMGNSCDALDNLGGKGRWYKNENKYHIKIGDTVIKLNASENIIINSQCLKEPEPAPQTKTQITEAIDVAKQELVITPPKNAEIIKTEKSANGSISLTFLVSLFGLLAWRVS